MREFRQKAEFPTSEVLTVCTIKSTIIRPSRFSATHFLFTKPSEFFRFYRDKMLCLDKKPNKAHYKLAELEKAGKLSAVVTQNIDGLHQAAGSKRVYELHGSVLRNYCTKCGRSYDAEFIKNSADIPKCTCGGIIKPDVVLYEEGLDDSTVTGAVNAISKADTLIIAGTSLTVYPAAGFIRYFGGDNLVLINRDPTPMDKNANLVFHEKVENCLTKLP